MDNVAAAARMGRKARNLRPAGAYDGAQHGTGDEGGGLGSHRAAAGARHRRLCAGGFQRCHK